MSRGARSVLIVLAIATAIPAAAFANENAPAGDVIRLSPDESEQAIEAGAARRALEAETEKPDRRIHGEMGVMVGTGGMRAIYGTAAVPLGDNAGAVISFSHERNTYRGGYYGYPDAFGRYPLAGPVFP